MVNYVLGPFFLVLCMIAYQSALMSRKLPCSKNVVVVRLTHLFELLNGDFVKYSLTEADENDPKKIKEMLVKGRDLKRQADKTEKDIVEIEKRIELLKSKRKCR